MTTGTARVLARSAEIERIIARLAHQILEPNEAEQGLVLLGCGAAAKRSQFGSRPRSQRSADGRRRLVF